MSYCRHEAANGGREAAERVAQAIAQEREAELVVHLLTEERRCQACHLVRDLMITMA
ncbi:MAG: hypothetical protein QOD09_1548 [Bradyrhizobium sp.]|nr:hypothetical protein [Bradyrhizobium sp.]MEA2951846.1 hypothetical protein [Alphaproteobacteria bacterium]